MHEAPDSGYEKSIQMKTEFVKNQRPIINELTDEEYLIFRVRTEADDQGRIIKANYGKIYGSVQYGSRSGLGIVVVMLYYFNPEVNSRSLEFDKTRNIFNQHSFSP